MALMIYKFAHGIFRDHIVDCLKARGSTMRKYIDIVCDILVDGQNLFSQCINKCMTGECHLQFHDIYKVVKCFHCDR
jgi:hypothetical protein